MSSPEPNDVGPKYGGDIRASDADRDMVLNVLTTAFDEGRLTAGEHEERISAAAAARTFDDLIPLTRDLVPLNSPIAPQQTAANLPDQQPTRLPTIDRRSTGDSDTLVAIFGGSTRKGSWRARRRINVFAFCGGNELDFTEAIFEDDVIEVSGFWVFGGCDIRVPEGVEISDQIVGIFGGSDVKHTKPLHGGPKIVIKGLALFGGCEIKGPKPDKKSKKR